ncbi:hypothetical protein OHT61_16495 [Streptomyces sp. NBC_00178]|uniref:hypothetical protein n=1 Tax=Streptomyces sp. NBC_00178 TaxID=2975672 RepID=UPI002E2CAD1C|nr:hypothetical protein [Streptomyces sp. NBC_00178]
MPTEVALLESPALRVEQMGRVEVLDKVKSLVMLPDGIHVRTEDVAHYFEVSTASVRRLTDRHQQELLSNGMRVLRGSEVRIFHSDTMSPWKGDRPGSHPQVGTRLRLYTRRAVLNVAMLLRESDVARSVRTHLLDAQEDLRTSYASLDRRVTRIEGCLVDVGSALQELAPVLGRMSQRLDSLDHRADRSHQVVGAISLRLTDVSLGVVRLESRLGDLVERLGDAATR